MSDRLQNAVAIIGIAGRFPGAENAARFWRNLCAGQESIRSIPEHDLEDGLSAAERSQGRYVAARALLENVDQFDAEFFHFLPREAELTDPQQRLLIECAWEAFEDAGYDPAAIAGNVGVFAGSSVNTYLLLHLASDPKFREEFTRSYQVGSFPALVGNGQDFLATRISYKLNLRGPAMTVQSACSTSLLAVAQAWQSLVNYQSDLALAGAVSVSFPQRRGYFYQEGGMVSPDGHCRPFDQSSAGTVFGAGAGMVLRSGPKKPSPTEITFMRWFSVPASTMTAQTRSAMPHPAARVRRRSSPWPTLLPASTPPPSITSSVTAQQLRSAIPSRWRHWRRHSRRQTAPEPLSRSVPSKETSVIWMLPPEWPD